MHCEPKPDLAREQLAPRIPSYYPEFAGRAFALHHTRFSEASSYPLYEFKAVDAQAGLEKSLIVKFAPVYEDINEGLVEFANLSRLYGPLEDAGLGVHVPRPLDFLGEINALVTEKVAGERFNRLLVDTNSIFAARGKKLGLVPIFERCGRWLRFCHDSTDDVAELDMDDRFLGGLSEKLRSIQSFGFPKRVGDEIEEVVGAAIRDAAFPTVKGFNHHGDYGPQNIVVDGDEICVFDLQRQHNEAAYNDIGYFLVTLDTMNLKNDYLTYDRKFARNFNVAFLRGYFGSEPGELGVVDRLLLELYYLKNLVFRCEKQRLNLSKHYPRVVLTLFDKTITTKGYPRRIARSLRHFQRVWAELKTVSRHGG